MKPARQVILERGIDEKAAIRTLTSRSKHGWKRGKDHRFYPGQPDSDRWRTPGYLPGLEPPMNYGYLQEHAQNDLLRIAASPLPVAEYCELYLIRNHLKR